MYGMKQENITYKVKELGHRGWSYQRFTDIEEWPAHKNKNQKDLKFPILADSLHIVLPCDFQQIWIQIITLIMIFMNCIVFLMYKVSIDSVCHRHNFSILICSLLTVSCSPYLYYRLKFLSSDNHPFVPTIPINTAQVHGCFHPGHVTLWSFNSDWPCHWAPQKAFPSFMLSMC